MSQTIKTGLSHPLRVDAVAASGGGLIGMTFCPGKVQSHGYSGHWRRDLGLDLDRIRDWGAVAVVTLVEAAELDRYRVPQLGAEVRARGMEWHHLPIVDADIPRAPFDVAWPEVGPLLRAHLAAGRRILLHCLGGLGRTGTVAARLLIEMGQAPDAAIRAVRQARPGALETHAQVAYARAVRPLAADGPSDAPRGSDPAGCMAASWRPCWIGAAPSRSPTLRSRSDRSSSRSVMTWITAPSRCTRPWQAIIPAVSTRRRCLA